MMVSLVNQKGEEKLLGTFGEFSIGRGPLLEVTDKRVSRNHALIKVEENGNVSICTKHTNPCFHKPASDGKFVQLPRNEWRKLEHNDEISLLHYSIVDLVFTVKFNFTITDTSKESVPSDHETAPIQDDNHSRTVPQTVTGDTSVQQEDSTAPQSLTKDTQDSKTSSQTVLPETSTTSGNKKTRKLPAWLLEATDSSLPSNKTKNGTTTSTVTDTASDSKGAKATGPTKTSSNAGKPKRDPPKRKREESEEKEEEKEKEEKSHVTSKENRRKCSEDDETILPPCPYGRSCYRKNPTHFKEFSHDFDEINSEEEEDKPEEEEDKPECPYGTSCYRRNETHRRQYKHTTAPTTTKRTRGSTRGRNKKPKKSALAGDSDDDGEENTYNYNDSFIDDDEMSSSTSYGPDSEEDEDWAPIDDDDVKELVSDANDFISNKKMHR